jgi:hypothetical protein
LGPASRAMLDVSESSPNMLLSSVFIQKGNFFILSAVLPHAFGFGTVLSIFGMK